MVRFNSGHSDEPKFRTSLYIEQSIWTALTEYANDKHISPNFALRDELKKLLIKKGYLEEV